MLAEERRFRIRGILSSQRTVSAAGLQDILKVTAATIRRDLTVLEREGVLVRSHGGAVSRISSTSFQPAYEGLPRGDQAEKMAIAAAARKFLIDGDTIFMEGSTTVFELARSLDGFHHLTVATNSPTIVCQLQHWPGVTVVCTGGELQKDQFYLSGLWAQRAISEIRVDKAVMGMTAIDPKYGHSCASPAEAQVKRMLVKAGKVRIGLVDGTKFGKQAFVQVGPVSDFDTIITDSGADPAYINALRQAGVEVIVAEVEKTVKTRHQGRD
jgi:DeoR family fructose operon transcriptional repressor